MTKNTILISIVVICLGIAAWRLIGYQQPEFDRPEVVNEPGICLNCREERIFSYPIGEAEPHECPLCKERAVYIWRYCYTDQAKFIPRLSPDENGVLRVPPFPPCPHCGNRDIGALYPEDPDHQNAPHLPLPEWQ